MRLKEILEAVVDVALQGRGPVTPGSLGLMKSRADFGLTIGDSSNIYKGAVAQLAAELERHENTAQMLTLVAQQFKMDEAQLSRAFHKVKGISPEQYHHQQLEKSKHDPIRI